MTPSSVDRPAVEPVTPRRTLGDLLLSEDVESEIRQLLAEWRQVKRLRDAGLTPTSRCLFHGPPGTGKTATAEAIAGELGWPLFVARMGGIFHKLVGETPKVIEDLFKQARATRGVYVMDEADALVTDRVKASSVHQQVEICTMLQQMERPLGKSILVLTTNCGRDIDAAVWRRIDMVVHYPRLGHELLVFVGAQIAPEVDWGQVVIPESMSPADLEAAVWSAKRRAVVAGVKLDEGAVGGALERRQARAVQAAEANHL